jgi:2-polyprenyl-3-methyl-5-hydroxy-6-metoxy-1,4-benzoquinol methylase
MRKTSVEDCAHIFNKFKIDINKKQVIDVGGTEVVSLVGKFVKNPLLDMHQNIFFLDKGFNVEYLKTKTDEQIDFLDKKSIKHLEKKFDITYCFDTLEHVHDPFTFCENFTFVTKPGGCLYVSTLFMYGYHPSPGDFFRYSKEGLSIMYPYTRQLHLVDMVN